MHFVDSGAVTPFPQIISGGGATKSENQAKQANDYSNMSQINL